MHWIPLSCHIWRFCSVLIWMTTLKWLPSLCPNHQLHSSHHCACVSSGQNDSTHTQWAGSSRSSYFLLQVLQIFVCSQAETEQRWLSLSSKLCFFFRFSLIKKNNRSSFHGVRLCLYSFLNKCQPMTFFEVIYSPQKADAVAAFVWPCLLMFTAIIFYHLTRTCTYAHNHTHYSYLVSLKLWGKSSFQNERTDSLYVIFKISVKD